MFVFLSWMAILAMFGYSLHFISCMVPCYSCNELDNDFCSGCLMCPNCCKCQELSADDSDNDTAGCSCHKRHLCRDEDEDEEDEEDEDEDDDDDDEDEEDDDNLPLIKD